MESKLALWVKNQPEHTQLRDIVTPLKKVKQLKVPTAYQVLQGGNGQPYQGPPLQRFPPYEQ